MARLTPLTAPSTFASSSPASNLSPAKSRDAQPGFTRAAVVQADAMKRRATDDLNPGEPKRHAPGQPPAGRRAASSMYDPATTPQRNPFYWPELDAYLGLPDDPSQGNGVNNAARPGTREGR